MKANIVYENNEYHYFDKNGVELKDGDTIIWEDGRKEKIYLTDQGQLGTDATNPKWIETGRASACEYGIYPLEWSEMSQIAKYEEEK